MGLYSKIKRLIIETVADFPATVVDGLTVMRSRKLWFNTNNAWYQITTKDEIPAEVKTIINQIEVGGNIVLSDTHSLKTLIITANCAITVPNSGISNGFQCSIYVRNGFIATLANSGTTFVGNNSMVSVGSQKTATIEKILTTQDFILKIEG